jgi:magnesium transporter
MQKTKLIELDLVLGKNFVVSSHRKEIPSFSDLKGNKLFLEKLFRKGPDFMLHRLVDMEVDNYFPEIDEISTQIDNLEEEAVEKSSPDVLRKILKMRQTVTRIRKISMAQREKMSFLAKKDYKLITDKSIPYFRDVYDHSIIVLDSLDDCRSTIANLFDIYMSSVNNKMSEVMKVLSVIATIALPLTALSSIYGTNFRVLPGAEFAYGFWVMILVMVLMCLSMLYYFRRKGWF